MLERPDLEGPCKACGRMVQCFHSQMQIIHEEPACDWFNRTLREGFAKLKELAPIGPPPPRDKSGKELKAYFERVGFAPKDS